MPRELKQIDKLRAGATHSASQGNARQWATSKRGALEIPDKLFASY